MNVKYSRLPNSDMDEVKLDFESAFTYSKTDSFSRPSSADFRSAFTYKDWNPQEDRHDARLVRVKQNCLAKTLHWVLTGLAVLLIILTCPVSLWFCIKKITPHERIVIFRLGRMLPLQEHGTVFVIPCIDKVVKVDLRIRAFNVPPQHLITQDRGLIEVGADVYYKIMSVQKYVTSIQDMNQAIRLLVQASLKNNFVQKSLSDIESDKLGIVGGIMESSNKTCKDWGVLIHEVRLSPIKILKRPESNSGMPAGLPQTFQQLASAFLQASASGDASTNAIPKMPESVTLLPDTGAAGVDDALLHNIPSPREFIGVVKTVMSESMVRSIGSVYMFQLSGPDGGVFFLDLKNDRGDAGEGLPPCGEPDATLTLTVGDMQSMFIGQLSPLQAYMSGRLKVSGDLSAATQLGDVIKTVMKKVKEDRRDPFIV